MTDQKKDAKRHIERGLAEAVKGNIKKALSDFNTAISLDPNNGIAYYARGKAKYDLGLKEEALKDYNKTVELNLKSPELYADMGLAKSNLGRKEEAINDYDDAIRLNPKYANAYCNRGNAKSDLGRKEEAINDYDKAIKHGPKNAEAYYNRGGAKFDLGGKEEAINDYDEAIELDPKFAQAYYNRGVVKDDLGQKKEAIKDYAKAIKLNPKNVFAYNNRGIIKYNFGRKKEALKDFNRAIKLEPKGAGRYYLRGVAKYDLGKKKEAIKDYKLFVELADDSLHRFVIDAKKFIADFEVAQKLKRLESLEALPMLPAMPYKHSKPEAVLFIDICNSTEIMNDHGPDHYLKMFSILEKTFFKKARKPLCDYSKCLGDGYMAIFGNCIDAVNSAIGILTEIEKYNGKAENNSKINLRIGISYGEIKVGKNEDRFGLSVNVAARIEGFQIKGLPDEAYNLKIAKQYFPVENRIFITEGVYKQIKTKRRFKLTEIGEVRLKGIDGLKFDIYRVNWKKPKN